MQVSPTALYTYPAVVILNEPRFGEASFDARLNPPVLEVGSEENGIGQHALVYPERSTLWLLIKVRTGRIEKDLVKFQLVRLCERFLGQRSRLGVSLAEFLRLDPIFKILPRFPKRKHNVGIVVIDRA